MSSGGVVGEAPPRPGRRRVVAAVVLPLLVAALVVVRPIVRPDLAPLPAHADAVVVLGGPGDRRALGLRLVGEGRAPVLALSISTSERAIADWCDAGVLRGEPVICFHSEPFTTRGEARSIAGLARQHGWRSVILVTSTDQAARAELRVSRCFDGRIYVANAHLPAYRWPVQVVYQAAAFVKAYTFQRSC